MTLDLHFTVATKVCSCCGKEKPLTDFYLQSYTGVPSNQCKECTKIKKSVVRQKTRISKFVSKEKIRNMEAVDYTLSDWRDAMIHFGGKCCYCGKSEGRSKKSRFDKEHFLPISMGGKTVRSNIGPCCPTCNRARGNKPLLEWYRQQEFWTQEREDRIKAWINQ